MCLNCVMNIDVDICMIGRDWPSRAAQRSGQLYNSLQGHCLFKGNLQGRAFPALVS